MRWIKKKNSSIVLAVVGTAIFFGLISGRSARADEKELKIGVVDVFRVSDEYLHAISLKKKIEGQIEAIKKEVQEIQKELENLSKEYKIAGPNRKEEIKRLIQDKEDWYKIRQKRYLEQLKIQNKDYTSEIYKDILKAVKIYGRKNGFDLILKSQTIPDKFVNEGEIARQAATNIVIFNKKEYDITDDIIKMLNTLYKENLKKKAATKKDGKEDDE